MATPDKTGDMSAVPEAVIDEEHKGFPVIWLLPLVAVLVGGWLIWKTIAETGPSITISFETAEGIQAGKTKIKYRDVEVGKVDSITSAEQSGQQEQSLACSDAHFGARYGTDSDRPDPVLGCETAHRRRWCLGSQHPGQRRLYRHGTQQGR